MTNPDKTRARAGRLVPQEQVFASVRRQLLKRLESCTPAGRQTPPKERPT